MDMPFPDIAKTNMIMVTYLSFKLVTAGRTIASLKIVMVVKKLGAMMDNGPQPMPNLDAVKDVYLADGLDGFVGQTMELSGPEHAAADSPWSMRHISWIKEACLS
eukprot:2186382-Amphidinium_carterae.1